MFCTGGQAKDQGLGDFQIRDKKTGIVYDIRKDFINTFAFSPYKILYDDSLEKGDAVQRILEDFKKKDAPKLGPFQMGEDVGTNVADTALRAARFLEPAVRSTIGFAGQVIGADRLGIGQALKDIGDPVKVGLGGLTIPRDESYIPTNEDRARFMLRRIVEEEQQPDVSQLDFPLPEPTSFDFRQDDMGLKVSEGTFAREQMLQQYSPEDQAYLRANPDIRPEEVGMRPVREITSDIDPLDTRLNIDEISTTLDELSGERQDLEARFDAEDVQRPKDVDVDEITSLLNDIQPPLVNLDITEEDTKLGIETKFEGLSPDELKTEIANMNIPDADALINEELLPAQNQEDLIASVAAKQDEKGDPNKARNPTQEKLNTPGFFGTDRFLDFIRNVGAGLSETGQFGPGLVLGAAKAAEERAARDIAEAEREAEINKLIAIEDRKAALKKLEPMSGADIEKAVKFEDEIREALRNFDEDERIVSDINQIINEDLNDPDAFGVKGYITKISNDLAAAAGMGAQEWSKLSAAKRTQLILDVTAQRSVRSILGESGKTISNLDREIVAKIFGSVGVFTSPAEIKKKLENSRANIIEAMRSGQNAIISRTQGLKKLKYPSDLLDANESIIDRILKFDFNTITTYQRGDDVSGFTEIDL